MRDPNDVATLLERYRDDFVEMRTEWRCFKRVLVVLLSLLGGAILMAVGVLLEQTVNTGRMS